MNCYCSEQTVGSLRTLVFVVGIVWAVARLPTTPTAVVRQPTIQPAAERQPEGLVPLNPIPCSSEASWNGTKEKEARELLFL